MTVDNPHNHLRIKGLNIDTSHPVVLISPKTASLLGCSSESRVSVEVEGVKRFYASVIIAGEELIAEDEVGVPSWLFALYKLRDGEKTKVSAVNVIKSLEYIKQKAKGKKLNKDEISSIVSDVVNGLFDDSMIAFFLTVQETMGMDDEEIYNLTLEMARTGTMLSHPFPVYDVHSIGGVPGNSKVALVTVPTAIAFGLKVPKTSSRAIVSPSGTADTMEVLAKVDLTPEQISEALIHVGGTLAWSGKLNLSPADDIFVRVERKLRIDPWSQVIASILSKKVAMGITGLVTDIPTGEGAKVINTYEAEKLSARFLSVSHRLGISTKVLITFGEEPIGFSVGPALEAREALEVLIKRAGPLSFVDKALSLVAAMLEVSGKANYGEGLAFARKMFESGKPEAIFRKIIEYQGGNPEVRPEDIKIGGHSYTFKAPYSGAVVKMNNESINVIARAAGAPYDKGAGILFHVKLGYRVEENDPLFTIYSNSPSNLNSAIELARSLKVIEIGHMVLKSLP